MSAGAAPIAGSATTPSIAPAWALRVSRALSDRGGASAWSKAPQGHPNAKQIPLWRRALLPAALALVRRVFVAEAVLWATAVLCALAGFPAALTAFCVALVGLVVNLWLAVRTLAPIARKIAKGGKA